MKRGRPSASIDWACLTLTKDAVRYSRPYVSYYIDMHVLLFQTAFVDSSRVWRGMGPSALDFSHRFLQSPCHYLSVWSSGDSAAAFSCPSTPRTKPQEDMQELFSELSSENVSGPFSVAVRSLFDVIFLNNHLGKSHIMPCLEIL